MRFRRRRSARAELLLEFTPENGLDLGAVEVCFVSQSFAHVRFNEPEPPREDSGTFTRDPWIGGLQRQGYRLGDKISEMNATAENVSAVDAHGVGDTAYG